jgi:CRP-like cAMP-binding protein
MGTETSAYIDPVRQVVDGSMVIESVKEFRRILKEYPDDPALHKTFSDLLVRKRSVQAGAQFYEKSAELYIKAGMLAPAVLCRLLQWQIQNATVAEHQRFFDELQMGAFPKSQVARLIKGLSANELSNLMAVMKPVSLAAGEAVRKIGDQENALFIIGQGSVKLTSIEPLVRNETEHRTVSRYLSEDAFFGDVYPFSETRLSNYYAQAVRPSDLIRIDKRQMQMLCKKNPRIELGLIDLYRLRPAGEKKEYLRMVRRTNRHKLPMRVRMGIRSGNPGVPALSLMGYSRDISVGGICAVVDPADANTAMGLQHILNRKVALALPSGTMALSVVGTIVWTKRALLKGRKTIAMGVQFDEMSPQLSGMLVAYAGIVAKNRYKRI